MSLEMLYLLYNNIIMKNIRQLFLYSRYFDLMLTIIKYKIHIFDFKNIFILSNQGCSGSGAYPRNIK